MADNSPTSNNLVIGDGVTFKGSISAPGKAIINGVVSGELIADDLLIGQIETLTQERDSLKSRLQAARSRIDGLLDRLPLDIKDGA